MSLKILRKKLEEIKNTSLFLKTFNQDLPIHAHAR